MPGTRLVVHYHRPRGDYEDWRLWAWDRATESRGAAYDPTGRDDFGLVFAIDPTRHGSPAVGLLPHRGAWLEKDGPDRVWCVDEPAEIWLLQGVRESEFRPPELTPALVEARLTGWDRLLVRLSHPLPPPLEAVPTSCRFAGGSDLPGVTRVMPAGPEAGRGLPAVEIRLTRPLDPELDRFWELRFEIEGYRPIHLTMDDRLDGPEFVSEGPFGALCGPEATTFRVFAPTAAQVAVNLYREPAGGPRERVFLRREPRGVWAATRVGDLDGIYYTLSVTGLDPRLNLRPEVIDPWAQATTGHAGRGLILRDATPVADPPAFPARDAILYELHLRDFTISPDSGVRARGTYLGAVETGTHLPDDAAVTTGLDHLVELGINTVQILPLMDFENDESSPAYNWGYMPVHFNAPDGWYASTPIGPARVVELKRMIDGFHRHGLKVVLDVVLNHTAEKAPEKVYSFEGLVPGYYYRRWPDGTPANGSACGNEFRSEAPMARRFLLDTLSYWVTAYRVDGFRFDLMGLIDLETLTLAARELRRLNPELLLYGEPWAAGDSPMPITGKGAQRGRGFGVFDDGFRDAIKGGVFDATPGFIQGGERRAEIRRGLMGGLGDFADGPLEVIQFVECHDNATLFDRLRKTTAGRPDVSDADRLAMHRLAGALVLLAPGLPFLHAGQEMGRTKGGHENSYRAPDAVNRIRWSWKREFADLVAWHRGLIALRRAHPLFRPADAAAVRHHRRWLEEITGQALPPGVVGLVIERGDSGDPWEAACVIFSAAAEPVEVALPPGDWRVYVAGETAGSTPLFDGAPCAGRARVAARGVVVLAR